jgi:eukaryotic-like serine/threonine-protein kinase
VSVLPPGAPAGTEAAGDRIHHYKLLQKLGEGGCGIVYLAEQEEPVRRRVALKVIKLGMDTKAVVARFAAERQALAMMDHPNIAKVFDAGTTEAGRPFFVMELVRGVKITDYCDQHNLSTRARLDLFIAVCHAIQHAHQKGIIHRDIKPSNLLVSENDGPSGAGCPKVIDFGIAKATQGRLTDQTLFTAFEQFIGTPIYMSPEQAEMSGLDIDTRSDIYSLGVLLYELLTGRTPFDPKTLAAAGLDEIRRIIREVEPPRPSARLITLTDADRSTVAKLRSSAPAQLSTLLRGDLDWIVMRCLEKNRTRRYETASGLAMDLERHLRNETVAACPPSTAYIMGKLMRRHKFGFAAAGAIAAALVVGIASATSAYFKEKAAYASAVAAAQSKQRAEDESKSVRDNMVAQWEKALATANRQEKTEAARNASLLQLLKEIAQGIAPVPDGISAPAPSRAILDRVVVRLGEDRVLAETTVHELREVIGDGYLTLAEFGAAEKMFRELIATAVPAAAAGSLRDRSALTRKLNEALRHQGKPSEAATLSASDSLGAPNNPAGIGPNMVARQDGDAEALARELLANCRKTYGNNSSYVANALFNLALSLQERGNLLEAESNLREALAVFKAVGSGRDYHHANLSFVLAAVLAGQGKTAESSALNREAAALSRALPGEQRDGGLAALATVRSALTAQRKYPESEVVERTVVDFTRARDGSEAPSLTTTLGWLVSSLNQQTKFAEAEPLARELLALRKKQLPPNDWRVPEAASYLGRSLMGQAKYAEAEPLLLDTFAELEKRRPTAGADVSWRHRLGFTAGYLTKLYQQTNQTTKAAQWKRRADEIAAPAKPTTAATIEALSNQYTALKQAGKLEEAEAVERRIVALVRDRDGNQGTELASRLKSLADLLVKEKKFVEAEPVAREAIALRLKNATNNKTTLALMWRTLASSLMGQNKFSEAEPLLLSAYAELKKNEPNPVTASFRGSLRNVATHLSELYVATSRPEKAAEWTARLAEIDRMPAAGEGKAGK